MSIFTKPISSDWAILLLRLALAAIFIAHGAQKVFGWFGGYGLSATIAYFEQGGIPAWLGYIAAFTEIIGGLAMLVGLVTRIFALALFIEMIVAIAKVHLQVGFFMNWASQAGRGEGFEFGILLLATSLAVLLHGPGRFSLDWKIAGERPEPRY